MTAFRIQVDCQGPCGLLDSGLSTDPPTTPPPRNWRCGDTPGSCWDRWSEMDWLAKKHRHATVVSAELSR
jgi:hypothetical protein